MTKKFIIKNMSDFHILPNGDMEVWGSDCIDEIKGTADARDQLLNFIAGVVAVLDPGHAETIDELRREAFRDYLPPSVSGKAETEPMYPCAECGLPRTKAEGGTTFTVCDACWDNGRALN